MPSGAAGGTPLAELPSQRQRCGRRRAVLRLCAQAHVPPSCCDSEDKASSSALLFCCRTGAAEGLLCRGSAKVFDVCTFQKNQYQPHSKRRPACSQLRSGLSPTMCQGKRRAIAALLLHPSVSSTFPLEPVVMEQHMVMEQHLHRQRYR